MQKIYDEHNIKFQINTTQNSKLPFFDSPHLTCLITYQFKEKEKKGRKVKSLQDNSKRNDQQMKKKLREWEKIFAKQK